MKKSYAVIGVGRFGFSVARTLYDMGHDVLAVDSRPEAVDAISPYVTHAVQADVMDENSLRALGISNMDCVIIGMGHDTRASVLVTILCKELGAGMVISKAQDELHGRVLEKVGADRVVYPEREMGIRVAHNLCSTNILECIELSEDYSLAEIEVPEEWDGRTIGQLDIRKKYGINVLVIKGAGGKLNISPLGEDVLKSKDMLVVIGSLKDIRNLDHTAKKKKN